MNDPNRLFLDDVGIFQPMFYKRVIVSEITLPKGDWQNFDASFVT